jgi:ubiquinone/menaquinone biosynthesis C-methylase UbiE
MINKFVRSALKKIIPEKQHHIAIYFKLKVVFLKNDLLHFFDRRSYNPVIPPAVLRYRVHGDVDLNRFVNVGRQCSNDLISQLSLIGKTPNDFARILDWGCGCCRVLRHLMATTQNKEFFGCDINEDLVKWSTRNVKNADFKLIGFKPPTPYQNGYFNFIYGISVMTHLDEEYQFLWLEELQRISAPGAIIMLTVHGNHTYSSLSDSEKKQLLEKGIFYKIINSGVFKLDGLPDFYQATFHTKEYVSQKWSKYFTILKHVEKGINQHQDLVIMERRP